MILNNLKKFFFKRKKYNTRNIKDILNNIIKISYSNSFNTKFIIQESKSFHIFAYKYLGGENFVRGYSPLPKKNSPEVANLIEGYNIFYHSIQLQHTLIKKKDFDKMKSGFEFGIDMVYFADIGIISDELISFNLINTIVGYGFGFRIFASGAGVIGIDIGFNPYGQQFYHLSNDY